MANLGSPQNTIAILQKYNFRFQKKFGQNFLIDSRVLDKIIRAADITPEDFVGNRPRDWHDDTVPLRTCPRRHCRRN